METSPVLRALTASLLQKLSRKSCQSRVLVSLSRKLKKRVKLRESLRLGSVTISRASYNTFSLLSHLSHVTNLLYGLMSPSLLAFFVTLFFLPHVLFPGEKNVWYDTSRRLDDHQLTVEVCCQKYTTHVSTRTCAQLRWCAWREITADKYTKRHERDGGGLEKLMTALRLPYVDKLDMTADNRVDLWSRMTSVRSHFKPTFTLLTDSCFSRVSWL